MVSLLFCRLPVEPLVLVSSCFDATSSNSGMLCDKNSLSIDLTAGSKKFLANGKGTRPTPAANDPKPFPRCLANTEKWGSCACWA